MVSVPTEHIDISVTATVASTVTSVEPYGASGATDATIVAAVETLATRVAALTVSNTLLAQATVHSEGLQMADEIVRGNSVTIKATFKDALGATVTPSSAAVFISFPSSSGQRSTVELPLVNNAGEWSATWDSSNARVGEVFWSAQTKNTTPSAAVDGSFMLIANMANPENLT